MKDFIINVLIFAGLSVMGFALKTLGGFVTTLITNYLDNKERIIQPAFIGLSFCNFLFSLIFHCGFLPAICSFFYMLNMYKTMSVVLYICILYSYCASIYASHNSLLPNYIDKKSEYWCFYVSSFLIVACRYLIHPFASALIHIAFDVEEYLYELRIGTNFLFLFAALVMSVYYAIKTKKAIKNGNDEWSIFILFGSLFDNLTTKQKKHKKREQAPPLVGRSKQAKEQYSDWHYAQIRYDLMRKICTTDGNELIPNLPQDVYIKKPFSIAHRDATYSSPYGAYSVYIHLSSGTVHANNKCVHESYTHCFSSYFAYAAMESKIHLCPECWGSTDMQDYEELFSPQWYKNYRQIYKEIRKNNITEVDLKRYCETNSIK